MKLTKRQILRIPMLSRRLGPQGIGKELGCSATTANNWMNRLEQEGHKITRHKRGPKKITLK